MNLVHLKERILDISYKHKLSHIGSCLDSVETIGRIYEVKTPEERFVLSNGHAGLALYVVLESKGLIDAEQYIEKYGIHPDRHASHIDCSTGSLGHGLPIALGMAMSDRTQNVYVLISDGETAEGSVHEALRIMYEYNVTNLKIYVIDNGFSAYKETNQSLTNIIMAYSLGNIEIVRIAPELYLQGFDGHYKVLSEEEYHAIKKKSYR